MRRGLLGGGSCGLLEGRGLGIALTGVSAAVGGTRTGARVRVWRVVRQNVLCADVMTSMSTAIPSERQVALTKPALISRGDEARRGVQGESQH